MKRKAQLEVEKKVERVETDEDEALGDDLELVNHGPVAAWGSRCRCAG